MKIMIAKLLLLLLLFPTIASARCINPIMTPRECQFKREDTHLIMNQPARKFVEEDKVEEMISEADIFIKNYYSTVKSVDGDLGMRGEAITLMGDIVQLEAAEAVALAAKAANDPWSLKPIYTDILCQIYWDVLEAITQIPRDCPTTAELVLDAQQLYELEQRRQQITDMITNPNLVLGEQWAELQGDIDNIRNKYDDLVSFGKNIGRAEVEAKYQDTMSSFEVMLTQPLMQKVPMEQKISTLSDMEHHTIRDTIIATGESSRQSFNEDAAELERLKDMSGRAVGRMQAMEIQNMLGVQKVQKWTKISEQALNNNNLMAIEMGVNQSFEEEYEAQHIKMKRPIADTTLHTDVNDGTGWIQ